MRKCKHFWRVEHAVYSGRDNNPNNEEKCIRRFCAGCGLVQHTYTTGRWYKSNIGPGKMWDEYPEEMENNDT